MPSDSRKDKAGAGPQDIFSAQCANATRRKEFRILSRESKKYIRQRVLWNLAARVLQNAPKQRQGRCKLQRLSQS
jgi:hypothetical protein